MLAYAAHRIVGGLLVLVVVSFLVVVVTGPLLYTAYSSGQATAVGGPSATRPWYDQYQVFVKRLVLGPSKADRAFACVPGQDCSRVIGRLGTSSKNGRAVDVLVAAAAPTTFSLIACATVIWLGVSIPLGVLAALGRRRLLTRSVSLLAAGGYALPTYFTSGLALWLLAYWPNSHEAKALLGFRVDLFPIGGYRAFSFHHPWPWLHALLLPACTLALPLIALYTRLVRSYVGETLTADHVRTAIAKGMPERRVLRHHVLRTALIPLVALTAANSGALVLGAIFVESIFGLPGLGSLLREAIDFQPPTGDVPMLLGLSLVAACFVVAVNVVADIVLAAVDPRVRLAGGKRSASHS